MLWKEKVSVDEDIEKKLATASRSHVSIHATKFCTKYAASSPVGVIDSAKISPTLIATQNLVAVRGHA